jgi:hypothetical protein
MQTATDVPHPARNTAIDATSRYYFEEIDCCEHSSQTENLVQPFPFDIHT